MISLDLKNRRTYLIFGLVAFFTLFALWLRLLPMFTMGNTDNLSMVASDDPLYNLRQVELLVTNHLNYAWFDPMTFYPNGTNVYWGPLFPTIIAICCLITGATTRPEIISIGLLIPPLMAAAVTAIMYFVGKTCGDWKTGILASGFTAIVTGQYFYRSLYGYMDHHIAEVLFSTIFCLIYMYAILSEKDSNINLKNINSYKSTILLSVLAGIAYLLGFFVMPTMILFALIVGIFTVIQFIIDTYRNRTSEYLLILNSGIFIVAIIGLLVFGFKSPTPELSTYSIAHVYADLGMIYNNIRNERPEQILAIIWSVIILFSTWQHVRYEYYLAINVALLSALCVSFTLDRTWPVIRSLIMSNSAISDSETSLKQDVRETPVKNKKQKKMQKVPVHEAERVIIPVTITIIVLGLGILFAYTSASYSYVSALSNPTLMNPDWKESVEWLSNNTPDPGVGYYTIYPENTFQYPNESYGVMSWWDYGHLITTIGKRIPNANPFQEGVDGDNGAAAYFMATSEETANNILNVDGTRYVITDIEMDTGKFWAMSTWFNASAATEPYQENMFLQNGNTDQSYQLATLNKQPYYLTMISRLHNFDGSMTLPTDVYYVEYVDPSVTHASLPVIIAAQSMNVSAADQAVDQYNLKAQVGYHAAVLSPSLVSPVDIVPALQHYRLVHESPRNVLDPK